MATYSPPTWVERVDAILEMKGRGRTWLAQKSGIMYSRLARIMQGDPRYMFHDYMMDEISKVLEVPAYMIFTQLEEDYDGVGN
jgi:hypothetical protein